MIKEQINLQFSSLNNYIKTSINTKNKSFFQALSWRLSNIIPLFTFDEWKGYDHNYMWQCTQCGQIFYDTINFYKSPRCPICNPIHLNKQDYLLEIFSWLQSLNINVELKNNTILSPYTVDFYLPDYNLIIEFSQLYWISKNIQNNNYIIEKFKLANQYKFDIIHIFENEWIYKKHIVKNIIKSKLGLLQYNINSKECYIKEINKYQEKYFSFQNNLNGYRFSHKALGLFYKDELISILSLKQHNKYNYEIIHYINKINYNINKSFDKFINYLHNYSLILNLNKRYYNNFYNEHFIFIENKPQYWYFLPNELILYNTINKNKLQFYDDNLEHDINIKLNGYLKIKDCGYNVYIKPKQ